MATKFTLAEPQTPEPCGDFVSGTKDPAKCGKCGWYTCDCAAPVPSSARPDSQTVQQAFAGAYERGYLLRFMTHDSDEEFDEKKRQFADSLHALILAVRQEQADARPARTLERYAKHDDGCRKGKPTMNCPQCQGPLERVKQSANSMLNSYQFDAVKAGDFFCRTCLGGESQATTFKYWWERELASQPCSCGLDVLLSGGAK